MLGNYRSFDGEEISYLFLKGKKTIIFLHPLGTDWTYWKKTVAYFAKKGYGAVVPTLRGHSPERTKLKHISVEDHVRDIELLEEKLKLKNPVIIGCSIGGAIAAAYHTKHPAARCICINTPFDSAPKAIWLYFDIYAFLFMPIAMLLSLFKRRDFDFSRSKITNAVLLTFKTALKLHYRGVYLNYFWLRKLKGVKDSGVVKLVSRQDEVITPHYEPDYEIDGNHNCVISESNVVNPLLLKIIEKQ
ncbi:MAG: alpha/beta hydrolase [Candidatus Woesearchaeota archaeon]